MSTLFQINRWNATYCFDSVVEYIKHGADRSVLRIQMIINVFKAFFLELRRCNGRTIATYLEKITNGSSKLKSSNQNKN